MIILQTLNGRVCVIRAIMRAEKLKSRFGTAAGKPAWSRKELRRDKNSYGTSTADPLTADHGAAAVNLQQRFRRRRYRVCRQYSKIRIIAGSKRSLEVLFEA